MRDRFLCVRCILPVFRRAGMTFSKRPSTLHFLRATMTPQMMFSDSLRTPVVMIGLQSALDFRDLSTATLSHEVCNDIYFECRPLALANLPS